MTKFKHVTIVYEADVNLPADRFFDHLTDWTNVLAYLPEWHPFAFTHVTLAEGHSDEGFPRTRLMYLDKTALPDGTDPDSLPDSFAETLILADKEAGTVVYKVEPTLGMRNYYGIQVIEPRPGNTCHTKLTVQFDCPEDLYDAEFERMLIQVYKGVIHGIEESRADA